MQQLWIDTRFLMFSPEGASILQVDLSDIANDAASIDDPLGMRIFLGYSPRRLTEPNYPEREEAVVQFGGNGQDGRDIVEEERTAVTMRHVI